MTDNYQELANAIVLLAVQDYRKALKKLLIFPHNRMMTSEIRKLERFFRSSYCKSLTDIDAETLIKKLRQEVLK